MFCYEDRVRFSQTDEDRRMSLSAVVDAMQDCSGRHSDSLGISGAAMMKRHRAWLLQSWQIILDSYPMEGDVYISETRPWKFDRFFGSRCFALKNAVGEYYARANSNWIHVDTERMMPCRLTPEEIAPYGVDEPLEMDMVNVKRLSIPEDSAEMAHVTVRRHHIDANHHVNNAQYIRIAEEYIPMGQEAAEIRVEYRTAAKYGDVLIPRVGTDPEGWLTVALGAQSGTIYVVIKIRLRERS